jgi:hypothetical protein
MADMTPKDAYRAMFLFLDERYSRLPSETLGQLLGKLTLLEDENPSDPAVKSEWDRAIERAQSSSKLN